MIDRVTVRGFKSIRALEEFELRGLNVLIGANGAGKSNLIGVFRMLSELARDRLQLFVKREGNADALLFGGRRRISRLEVELSFNGADQRYALALEPVADGLALARDLNSSAAPQEYAAAVSGGAFSIAEGASTPYGGHSETRAERVEGGEFAAYVLPAMREWRVYHFHDTSEVAGMRASQAVRDNLRLKPDGANLGPFLRVLRERHPYEYREIVDAVRLVAPFFGGFVYRKDVDEYMELEWYHVDDADTPLRPMQLSDGTLRFMCLATVLLQPTALQPRLILIDEPELGLHPFGLALLAEMLESVSETRQVIVSTQSADLISEFRPEDVVVVNRRDGESVFERLDSEDLQDWLKVLAGRSVAGERDRRRSRPVTFVTVVCEGRTEQAFVTDILSDALLDRSLFIEPRLIPTSAGARGGALSGQRVLRYLRDILRQRKDTYVIGLDRIRAECRHFGAWLARIEALAVE